MSWFFYDLYLFQNKIHIPISICDWNEFFAASVTTVSKENLYQSQGVDSKVNPLIEKSFKEQG